MTPEGKLTLLHSFNDPDGGNPAAGLVEGTDGNFYGTTYGGGAYGYGTVFKITPRGALTTLHSFDQIDGDLPYATLVQGADGDFYGTTNSGGQYGYGTVFRITAEGSFVTLYEFDQIHGETPTAALVLGTDGNFYGTTDNGGSGNCASGCGIVFKITPAGALTILHSFDSTDGRDPNGALVQGTDGDFYGTTEQGGDGTACGFAGCGTVFGLSVGLGRFVRTSPTSGRRGESVMIIGTGLEDSNSVAFNGTAATFKVISGSLISATVPTGATTGPVQVVTLSATLTSNVNFRVQ